MHPVYKKKLIDIRLIVDILISVYPESDVQISSKTLPLGILYFIGCNLLLLVRNLFVAIYAALTGRIPKLASSVFFKFSGL